MNEKQGIEPDKLENKPDKSKNSTGTVSRLIIELMGQKWKIIIILIGIITSAVLGILYPQLLAEAINQVVDGIKMATTTGRTFQVNMQTMGSILLGLLSIFLFRGLISYIQQYVMAGVAQNLTITMRKKISDKLNKLPLSYFDKHKKGDIISRITSDLEKVADTLQEGFPQLFSSFIGIAGAIVIMITINLKLALVVLATVFISLIIASWISTKTQRHHTENQKTLGEFNANIEEAFTGNMLIKAFNIQERVIKSTEELSENLFRTTRKTQFITYVINPVIQLLNHFGYIVVAVGGAVLVIQGNMSIGYIQAFFQYNNKVSESVMTLAYVINSLQGAIAAAKRVYQFLDEPEEVPDKNINTRVNSFQGNVRFEHVRFGYQDDAILMKDIDINVKAGSRVAIVGPTGAGKTTFVNLLMRFYEIQGGRILIDGVDITEISRDELRTKIGMVLQDTWLFTGTVAENISYGRANASDSEILQAAQAARIDHFIRTMPNGYQTILDDEVASISAGQKQLFTIARAMLANPAIMILDEATSSVDTRTEIEIQKALNTVMKGRTSFIIAHRLSTIREADLILVMNNGTIIEQGTHTELIKQDGFYADLYNSQLSAPEYIDTEIHDHEENEDMVRGGFC